MAKSKKLGGGGRFAALAKKVAAASAKSHPNLDADATKHIGAAVAAVQGRKKYGATKMAKMAAVGRKHSEC